MKKRLKNVRRIIVSLLVVPLSFVKGFHEVGVLPSLDGAPVKHHYYYSMFDNLKVYDASSLIFVLAALAVFSILFVLFSAVKDKKVIRIAANVFYIATVLFFIALLAAASTVARNY